MATLLLAPTLALQLALPVPRLDADAVEYYSHVRSLYVDGDLDFANEFAHFGILDRYDKTNLTPTGHRRTIFAVGPSLMWMPFYAAGDVVARALGTREEGYSPYHIRAVTLASLFYGVLGSLLVFGVLRSRFPFAEAAISSLALFYGTFLIWYAVYEPVMSHSGSFFFAALTLAIWWPARHSLSERRALVLGLVIGLGATVRWQSAVLLLLPAFSLLRPLGMRPARTVVVGLGTLAAFGLGALPQMLAWKAIFGSFLLADPPHGADFLRLDHPYLLQTFFSSRHGLLYWTPLLWAGFCGLLVLARRELQTAIMLLVPVAIMSYVNACSGDWWAGGSFSNRRFDSLLPLLALGIAACAQWLRQTVARRPGIVVVAGAFALTAWNFAFMDQYARNRIPRDDTVSFARVTENSADFVSEWVGTPMAWPANWIFAARHDLPVQKYDLMVGQYLFYRQNNLGGVIDIGDNRVDPGLLGEGWARRQACDDGVCRAIEGRARLFVPLDVPRSLAVTLRARGRGSLAVSVNGRPVAMLPLLEDLQELRFQVPRGYWRRELNELALETGPGGEVSIDLVRFERAREI